MERFVITSNQKMVTVYDFEAETMEQYSFAEKVNVGIYKDFEIDFSKII